MWLLRNAASKGLWCEIELLRVQRNPDLDDRIIIIIMIIIWKGRHAMQGWESVIYIMSVKIPLQHKTYLDTVQNQGKQ